MSARPSKSSLHLEVLTPPQREVLRLLAPHVIREGFYLGGGTALALRLGHRRSVDFDWFREKGIPDPLRCARDLQSRGLPLEVERTDPDTLHALVRGVRVTLLAYPYPLLQPAAESPQLGSRLASLDDLAAMKLAAVSQRGIRRDFFDVEALGRAGLDLPRMLSLYQAKYGVRDVGHVLAALTYFDDAERDPEPVLDAKRDWESVKATLRESVKRYAG